MRVCHPSIFVHMTCKLTTVLIVAGVIVKALPDASRDTGKHLIHISLLGRIAMAIAIVIAMAMSIVDAGCEEATPHTWLHEGSNSGVSTDEDSAWSPPCAKGLSLCKHTAGTL